MKFYRENNNYSYYNKIIQSKLSAVIYSIYRSIIFFKNGKYNNTKNIAFINIYRHKQFYLNNKYYGNQKDFTKQY